MLQKVKKQDQKGFTIIEVLIVLAIAGLILLIVFLAVPALQRNQRNTARKNDVARVGGAVTEFFSNKNGSIPTSANVKEIYSGSGNLSQYAEDSISIVPAPKGVLGPDDAAKIVVVTQGKCKVDAGGSPDGSVEKGTIRQVAIQFMIEQAGDPLPLCQNI